MTSPVYHGANLLALPQAAYTATPGFRVVDTSEITNIAFDLNVVSFQGGTAPTISFFIERQDANQGWSQIWTSGPLSAATNWCIDMGPGFGTFSAPSNMTQHAIFTDAARLRWAFGGTASPTTVTFSASIVGRH